MWSKGRDSAKTARRAARIGIDMAMTAALPLLMAYSLVGEALHEWVGVALFTLFIAHHALNGAWHRNLLRGRYTAARIVGVAINGLLFLLMLALTLSGIWMSRHAFAFLPIRKGMSLARQAHLVCSYWCFALSSLHLGQHGQMLLKGPGKPSTLRRAALWIAAAVGAYGVYAFVQRGIGGYMLLLTQFAFFDDAEPLWRFFLDYIAIMTLFALLGFGITKGLQKQTKRSTMKA